MEKSAESCHGVLRDFKRFSLLPPSPPVWFFTIVTNVDRSGPHSPPKNARPLTRPE